MVTSPQSLVSAEKDLLNLAARNEILRELFGTPAARNELLSELKVVSLGVNQVLYEQGDKIDVVYFPIDSVVSGLAIMEDGTTIETSMIGCEGI